jgi:TonB family protein
MSPLLLDHLWQSTVVLAVIGALTLFFRNNGAHVRHVLWTAASVKFLVPFALLNGLGTYFAHLTGLKLPSLSAIETLYVAGQPFSDGPVFMALPAPGAGIWLAALGAWIAGAGILLGLWFSRWLKLRAALRAARDADIAAAVPVKLSPAQLEPGLVGIFRSVLLLPEGITDRLTPAELQAVVVHEVCHMRRRDNLIAALHMLVEALFWFWPPVWWLGARLIAERERACDEAVLAAGNDPQTYAESILKVCKFYVSSPLACAAGIAGANLSQRMETIMENRMLIRLNGIKKTLLGGAAAALVLTPLAAGLLWSPVAQAAGGVCTLYPVAGTHLLPPYPAESQKAGETGTVLLQVTITRNGHVSGAKVTHSSGFARLDERAASYVRQNYLWQPNACRETRVPLKVVFSLADPAGHKAPGGTSSYDTRVPDGTPMKRDVRKTAPTNR